MKLKKTFLVEYGVSVSEKLFVRNNYSIFVL